MRDCPLFRQTTLHAYLVTRVYNAVINDLKVRNFKSIVAALMGEEESTAV
jgi:hypothetical protein